MLPLARPAMAALAIFAFVQSWNDYLWPLVVATAARLLHPDRRAGAATGLLRGRYAHSGSLMSRGVIGSLPLIIIFLLFQRQLIRGISLASGEK